MFAFYFFAAIVVWLGILSLRGGLRFAKYVREQSGKEVPEFAPFASVIAPCCGLDQGLSENVAALFRQRYPAYEIIFVTAKPDDPAVAVIEMVKKAETSGQIPARLIVAGESTNSGQKVHNLRIATSQIAPGSEVLVFVDSDARPGPDWLPSLIGPLFDGNLGAATGYRWFLPVNGGLASHLRSVWNASIASALGGRTAKNFCWGGSTAIRRSLFESLQIRERWRDTVSDDFTLTRILHESKLPIHFVPACLLPSLEDCSLRELLEFTNRQLKITRVYAQHLWKSVLIGSILFNVVFFTGLGLVVLRAAQGHFLWLTSALLTTIFLLGAAKAYVRWRAVEVPLMNYRKQLRRGLLAHVLLWPIASLLFLVNSLSATFSRRIEWRGITYELKSPTETVIIAGES